MYTERIVAFSTRSKGVRSSLRVATTGMRVIGWFGGGLSLRRVLLPKGRRNGHRSNATNGDSRVIRLTTSIDANFEVREAGRGSPSTSTNLKEALCEKIPLHHDLLRNLRRQFGGTVVSRVTIDDLYGGLRNARTIVRETSEFDPNYGIRFRGFTIPEVITLLPRRGRSPSVEAVFWLLLTGDVPTREQTDCLAADWSSRRERRRQWWFGIDGGIVGSVVRALPETITPTTRLSIALCALDASYRAKHALQRGAPSHTLWEYAYEDSMDLLAVLPAIVALIGRGKEKGSTNAAEEGDWIDFLLKCLGNVYGDFEGGGSSVADFLRLYVTLNADEDGGTPGAHVTQILGASRIDANEALAAGALAYADEPRSGTMLQCAEFQTRLKSIIGSGVPNEETLRDLLMNLPGKNNIIGHKESACHDPRYTALLHYAKEHLPENFEVKLSQDVTRILTLMRKNAKDKRIYPEQSVIAAPIFQYYGLKNMKFNQLLFCASRALGAIASIIWAKAIDAPVEHPKSNSTFSYLNSLRGSHGKPKRKKYTRYFLKK